MALSNGPRRVADLAEETRTHERSPYRLLRSLAKVCQCESGRHMLAALLVKPTSANNKTTTPLASHSVSSSCSCLASLNFQRENRVHD